MAPLTDIVLGSKKNARGGWAAKTGRSYDIILADYGRDAWSIACNINKIGPGTIGWIVRHDGDWGHIAGILALSGAKVKERRSNVTYARGKIFPLPREWWIDGARLNRGGWRGVPFQSTAKRKRMALFQSGQRPHQQSVKLIEDRLHPVVRKWVQDARRDPRRLP